MIMKTHRQVLKSVRAALLIVVGTCVLAACASEAPLAGPVPKIGFAHLGTIPLNVDRIGVSSTYQSPMKAPNAEQRFPTSPAQAMKIWAGSRLQAVGGAGSPATAQFVIEDASVIETKLEKTKGFKGMFTYEPTARYDAHAVAHLSVQEAPGGVSGIASGEIRVSATRSVEVRENATLGEREKAWFEMIEALMADFNSQMETQIHAHLQRWMR
ncbi:hypothetical protein [Magnetovibrio blakemorei]|uniref:Uncharacterized protein n=1 Tax=Magnetovibrio blakemorei TaxID=28181 RepID=A0A1E5QC15_9PROT|nr:hypothetical protein [Magnetovibrio blakemorei]OEJ69223.1 hypothetical protein BEN30_03815 [Magnetovibrio blakemorei]